MNYVKPKKYKSNIPGYIKFRDIEGKINTLPEKYGQIVYKANLNVYKKRKYKNKKKYY